jgi:hypothetical protein
VKGMHLVLLSALLTLQIAADLPALQKGSAGLEASRWGYVDKSGKFVIQPQFEDALEFFDGLAAVEVSKKWGYIDKTGKGVIPARFDEAAGFSEGIAAVKMGGKWGYIDKAGTIVAPAVFDDASYFSGGLALVNFAKAWGYIDKNGKSAIRPQFIAATDFSQGLAAVSVCRGWNAQGAAVVPESEGCGWGYINKEGEFAIPPKFPLALPFSEGLAGVWDGRMWEFLDRDGKVVIPPMLEHAEIMPFRQGVAIAKQGGLLFHSYGFINREGKWVAKWRYEYSGDFFSEGLVPVAAGPKKSEHDYKAKYGYFCLSGKLCIRPQFDEAGSYSEGVAAVTVSQSCGYINKLGEYVIKPQFQSCGGFSEGLAPVQLAMTR